MTNLKIINSQTITNQNQYPDSTVYMLTYDHGGLILWGSDHFRERLRNAIEWLDKYPGFKIGLDNEAQIYDYFAKNETVLLDELKGYLEKYKGRFAIGSCTYGQPLSQFINEESNIRQIYYALKSCQEHFNYSPPVYLMSEHAMHSQIPQILNGFDFDGAIMRTHFMMYGYNPTFDVPIGWWTGLDGSRIATISTYPGEGAEFGKTPVDNWILTRYPGPECSDSMEIFRKQFIHIHPLLATRADDSGLRREGLVQKYENNPQYQWILLDELMEIFPEPEVEMVTLPNDFTVRMPWGYCGNEIWNDCRKGEVMVLTAERLSSLEFLNGGQSYEQELEQSWKTLLLAQHHDVQIVGLLPEAHKLLPASINYSEKVIQSAMGYFASNMSGGGIRQVTVFNPHSWPLTRWITTEVDLIKGEASEYGFISDVPYQFEITVHEDSPQIDCKVEFFMNGQKIGLLSDNKRDSYSPFVHEEKLRFRFFPNVDENVTGIRDLPFAIAHTTDSCVEGNYWTALSDCNNGIAFFNKGTMGSIRENDGSFSIPLAYSMYYIWGTRMLYGNYSYEFAIYPFPGNQDKTDIHKSALEYNFPVPVIATEPGNGKLGNHVDLLSFESDHVILSAIYPSAGNVYIRLYEYKGKPSDISFPVLKNDKSLTEVNLMGNMINQASESIHFNPWQIKTFRMNKK